MSDLRLSMSNKDVFCSTLSLNTLVQITQCGCVTLNKDIESHKQVTFSTDTTVLHHMQTLFFPVRWGACSNPMVTAALLSPILVFDSYNLRSKPASRLWKSLTVTCGGSEVSFGFIRFPPPINLPPPGYSRCSCRGDVKPHQLNCSITIYDNSYQLAKLNMNFRYYVFLFWLYFTFYLLTWLSNL